MADKKICEIQNCGKLTHKGSKHCSMHSERIRKYGDPEKGAFKPRGSCTLKSCDRPHYGHGYCLKHYKRWKKYGDPHAGGTDWGAVPKWLNETAIPYKRDDCLVFPFSRDTFGYGKIKYKGRNIGAHVYVLRKTVGQKPTKNHECCHSCGNGHLGCVNPKHLYWGTRAENVQDAIAHGTWNSGPVLCGTDHPMAKRSPEKIKEAINLVRNGMTQTCASAVTGIPQRVISNVIHGKAWRSLGLYKD